MPKVLQSILKWWFHCCVCSMEWSHRKRTHIRLRQTVCWQNSNCLCVVLWVIQMLLLMCGSFYKSLKMLGMENPASFRTWHCYWNTLECGHSGFQLPRRSLEASKLARRAPGGTLATEVFRYRSCDIRGHSHCGLPVQAKPLSVVAGSEDLQFVFFQIEWSWVDFMGIIETIKKTCLVVFLVRSTKL